MRARAPSHKVRSPPVVDTPNSSKRVGSAEVAKYTKNKENMICKHAGNKKNTTINGFVCFSNVFRVFENHVLSLLFVCFAPSVDPPRFGEFGVTSLLVNLRVAIGSLAGVAKARTAGTP